MLKFLMIFLGGGLGSSFRWLTGLLFNKCVSINFPFATLFVNILGSFILGFSTYFFMSKTDVQNELKLFLTVGFCGGFTTFSTFALENLKFFQQEAILKSFVYIILNVGFSLLAVFLGGLCANRLN